MGGKRCAPGKVLTNQVAASTKYPRAAGEGERREDAIGFETSEEWNEIYRSEREGGADRRTRMRGVVMC